MVNASDSVVICGICACRISLFIEKYATFQKKRKKKL